MGLHKVEPQQGGSVLQLGLLGMVPARRTHCFVKGFRGLEFRGLGFRV